MYQKLNSEKIIKTAIALKQRIGERFPTSGLSGVAEEVIGVSKQTVEIIGVIQKPMLLFQSV